MGLKKHENLGVNELIHNQVLRTNIIRILWKTVWRITNEISGVKGLRYENRDYSFTYWTGLPTASKTEIKMFLQQKVVLIVVHNDVTMKSKLKRKQFIDSTLSVVALRNISSACERHSYTRVEKVHVHVSEQTTQTIIFPGYDIDSGICLAAVMDRS